MKQTCLTCNYTTTAAGKKPCCDCSKMCYGGRILLWEPKSHKKNEKVEKKVEESGGN